MSAYIGARRRASALGLRIVGPLALGVLGLSSCSDGKNESAATMGGANVGAAPSGGTASTAGISGASGGSGTFSAAGTFGNGAAGGQSGTGGMGGVGGTVGGNTGGGGASGGGGTAGGGGTPAANVYTINGCMDSNEAGAGGASGAGGDGHGNNVSGATGTDGGATGNSAPTREFASFTLYDCATDKPVQTCIDKTGDFQVAVTGTAPLTVLANLTPGAGAGSVIFTYDGVPQLAHNLYPYALGEDDNGDFHVPNPPLTPGEHTISIVAYDLEDGLGEVLGRASIVLTVVDGGP